MERAQSLATVVRVIQSAAPLTVARAWKRTVQTRSALVTRPSRSALKSRGNAFSEMCIRMTSRHVRGNDAKHARRLLTAALCLSFLRAKAK